MSEKTKQASFDKSSAVEIKPMSRREFMKKIAAGSGNLVLLSGFAGWTVDSAAGSQRRKKIFQFIAVDYTKCTGCRTCEAVCAASNHPLYRNGRYQSDIGNPIMSNIRVHAFNPDADVPVTCARCEDTPCVNVCPVGTDPTTGRRALYQDINSGTIINDEARCIACGSCVEACDTKSVGILARHPETEKPMRICTLCHGNPQCVKHCPYEAMSFLRVSAEYPFYRMSPEIIANKLQQRWYGLTA